MKKPNNTLKDTPIIPQEVYNGLPSMLAKCCRPFTDPRERDIILTSSLAALSSCLPNVNGEYTNRRSWTNCYFFIVAPPSSAKGLASFAESLVFQVHKYLRESSISDNTKGKNGLKIQANASAAAFLKKLYDYGEKGFLIDTEADTLANSLKQDWGDFSAMLRKAFHHEAISSIRKQNNESYEIDKPKLSILLTGTLDQIKGVIQSANNGLFSRFSFYTFVSEPEWKDVSPSSNIKLDDYFEECGNEILTYYKYLETHPIECKLTKFQWEKLNSTFCQKLHQVSKTYDENSHSIVKRHGLTLFRICMILASLRMFEDGEEQSEIVVSNLDFDVALILTKIYLQHSLRIYELLPGTEFETMPQDKRRFLNTLIAIKSFKREQAISIGGRLGLSERTVDGYLKQFTNVYIVRPIYGHYEVLD